MRIKVKQLNMASSDIFSDKNEHGGSVDLFEKNNEIYFNGPLKESSVDFFMKIYGNNGPFWKTYKNYGVEIIPEHDHRQYIKLIAGNIFFSKSIYEKYINDPGRELKYDIRGNYFVRTGKWSLQNVILMSLWPVDQVKKIAENIKFGLYANEAIEEYERLYKSSLEFYEFYSEHGNIYNPVKTAAEAMQKAVEMMEYYFIASLCIKNSISMRKSGYISNCELEKLSNYIEDRNLKGISEDFGFYSFCPYDISDPRFYESLPRVDKFTSFDVPTNPAFWWKENTKFSVARCMSIIRVCYQIIAQKSLLGDLVFFLGLGDLGRLNLDNNEEITVLREVARKRKEEFELNKIITLPDRIVYKKGRFFEFIAEKKKNNANRKIIAKSISSRKKVDGPLVNINSMNDYEKCTEGCIVYSRTLSPNLVMLYKKAAGVISENGGSLSHAAIIAREMKIPCFTDAKLGNVTDGQFVRLDGGQNSIFILEKEKNVNNGVAGNPDKSDFKKTSASKNASKKIALDKLSQNDFIFLSNGELKPKNAGNKASNLSKIFKEFNVPDGFVVDSSYFERLSRFEKISGIINEIKKSGEMDVGRLGDFCEKLHDEIRGVGFSKKLKDELNVCYKKLLSKTVAVRSSSSCEDLKQASFAGQFDSYLNVDNIEALENSIKNCWASFYSAKSILYRKEKRISDSDVAMAILVQKMIKPKYSGIAFSQDAIKADTITIEATEGSSEVLTSGIITPNVYIIEKASLSMLDVNANCEIDDNTIVNIAKEALKLEKYFKSPQDVEWCIDENGKIWIIQTRPITSTCELK